MNCKVCRRQSKFLPSRNEEDCLEEALERIRNHVKFFQNATNEKEQRLQQLQERNERLTKAVHLLQRQQQESLRERKRNSAQGQSPTRRKKSKTSPTTPDFTTDDEDDAAPLSLLNRALNIQQLLLLNISSTAADEDDHSDTIAETELTARSPRKLVTPAKRPHRQPPNKNHNENRNPLITAPLKKSSTTWLTKERASPSPTASACVTAERTSEWASKFIKPVAKHTISGHTRGPPIKKTASLSLSKRGTKKLHQTRLQLDVAPRKRSFSGAESTFCDDVIEASPNMNASLTKSKSKVAHSWLLRTDNSCSNASPSLQNRQLLTLTIDSDNDEDDVFDLRYTKKNPKQKRVPSLDTVTDAPIEFELRPDIVAAEAAGTNTNMSGILMKPIDSLSSSSVILLTPATQDIIFLDDTTCVEVGGDVGLDDTTQIKSMDLLNDLMRPDDDATSLMRLKEIERERIKKIQVVAKKVTATSKAESAKAGADKEKTKTPLKLKQENISLVVDRSTAPTDTSIENEKEHSSSEELDDCMPRPMWIKEEPESQTPLSVQERFNINCIDCRNYIKFFGDTMSDADIEAHLRKCKSHNMRPSTPEGFWNPLLLSFAPDDPRNEVLIDDRFVGKKRST